MQIQRDSVTGFESACSAIGVRQTVSYRAKRTALRQAVMSTVFFGIRTVTTTDSGGEIIPTATLRFRRFPGHVYNRVGLLWRRIRFRLNLLSSARFSYASGNSPRRIRAVPFPT